MTGEPSKTKKRNLEQCSTNAKQNYQNEYDEILEEAKNVLVTYDTYTQELETKNYDLGNENKVLNIYKNELEEQYTITKSKLRGYENAKSERRPEFASILSKIGKGVSEEQKRISDEKYGKYLEEMRKKLNINHYA